jgi:hypothetical protein
MSDKAELEALKARIEELERRAKPPEPFKPDPHWRPPPNPIDRLSMPVSVIRDMANAVPDAVVRQIVSGRAPQNLAPLAATATPVSAQNTSGWRESVPLSNPPGVALADKLMDAADRADRVELAQRLAKQELARRAMKE